MKNKLNVGIDLVTHHLGELSAGESYLLAGEHGAAKTTFVLQFLYQGLKERQTCALVSNESPKNLVAHAQTLGMDLSPHIKDGTLLLYEIARKDMYAPAELFSELTDVIAGNAVSRFALEGLAQSPSTGGPGGSLVDGMAELLDTLEEKKITAFITLDLPITLPMATLKEALEATVAGSFLLESTADERVKTFSVKTLNGNANDTEFQFKVEPGRGIVEAAAAKTSGIKFPRSDDN